jgi:1-acyl-sn-glycerol-3-phosphate acyltransferase
MIDLYYNVGTNLARFCFKLFGRWDVEGVEAIPPKGPLIVVSNHLSNADPPVLVASLPRQLNFMAKRSLFVNPVISHFMRGVGAHPVSREGSDIDALRWNLNILNHDQPVVLFPEGTRSLGEGMRRGLPGVAYIGVKSQAPILPVAITGTENILGWWRIAFPMCRFKVKIGDPFTLPSIDGRLTRPMLANLTDMIMGRIAALLPQSYRGYYAVEEAGSRH